MNSRLLILFLVCLLEALFLTDLVRSAPGSSWAWTYLEACIAVSGAVSLGVLIAAYVIERVREDLTKETTKN